MKTINLTRRDILRGAATGAASLGILGQTMRLSLAVEGSPLPINVITSNSNLTNTLLGVAQSEGFLTEFGLEPQYLSVADGSRVIPSIITGEVDFCTLNGIGLIFPAISRGGGIKLIGGSSVLLQMAIYSANEEVQQVSDLAGRVVGTGAVGALTHQVMVAMLRKKGVDPSTVQFRNIGSNPDIFRAVAAGMVDGGPSNIDVYYQQEQFGTHALSDGDLWTELPEYTYQGAFTSDRAIAEKREALVRTLAAFARLYRFVQSPESRESFLASYAQVVGRDDEGPAVTAWEFIQEAQPYSADIVLGQDRVDYMQELNVEMGVQEAVLPFEQVADMSLAEEALRLLD